MDNGSTVAPLPNAKQPDPDQVLLEVGRKKYRTRGVQPKAEFLYRWSDRVELNRTRRSSSFANLQGSLCRACSSSI